MIAPLFQIPVGRIDDNLSAFAEYQGSVLLIVNVASAWGLAPHYARLESVHEKVRPCGFVGAGFDVTTLRQMAPERVTAA